MFSALKFSLLSHGLIIIFILFITQDFSSFEKTKKINFEIIERSIVAESISKPNLVLAPATVKQPDRRSDSPKKSDNKISYSKNSDNNKSNNNDDLNLTKTEMDSLPIPASDQLITSGAQLTSRIVANRTDEARKAGYTGTAILLVLIDNQGDVRQVENLNQLEFGLDKKAIEIAKKLKFRPAKIKDESVAVKIRFSINFKASL